MEECEIGENHSCSLFAFAFKGVGNLSLLRNDVLEFDSLQRIFYRSREFEELSTYANKNKCILERQVI